MEVNNFKHRHFSKGKNFDAHCFILSIIKSAKFNITLIDNEINDDTLTLLSHNVEVKTTVVTCDISARVHNALIAYNHIYPVVDLITHIKFKSTYLIMDNEIVYLLTQSLSKFSEGTSSILRLYDFKKEDIYSLLEIRGDDYGRK